jgi:hypothetical protein
LFHGTFLSGSGEPFPPSQKAEGEWGPGSEGTDDEPFPLSRMAQMHDRPRPGGRFGRERISRVSGPERSQEKGMSDNTGRSYSEMKKAHEIRSGHHSKCHGENRSRPHGLRGKKRIFQEASGKHPGSKRVK